MLERENGIFNLALGKLKSRRVDPASHREIVEKAFTDGSQLYLWE
jgi:hypothetical protein